MTATAQSATMRCDYAGCTKAGTVEVDAWAYCPAHAGRQHLDAVTPTPRPRPTVVPDSRPAVDLDADTPAPPVLSAIALLLEQASGHTVARVRKAAERIETQLDGLRALIAEHAAGEQRRQADAAAKAKARADVDRLTAQLAAAKAVLHGKPAPVVGKSTERLCDRCARPSKTPGARGAWPRTCAACKAGAA